MIFKQYENGSCDIEFSKKEIQILNEKNKLHLSEEFLKHFSNTLVKICMDFKFKEEINKKLTTKDDKIEGE
jgi:hypothetical protein